MWELILIDKYYHLRQGLQLTEPKTRFDAIIQKLRDNGQKITPQRLAIVKILAKSEGHPSVENIHDQIKKDFPTMSLATVYRNILMLKSLGEVLELGFPDGSNRYDGKTPTPHPHLICIRCKKIVDPDLDSLDLMKKELALETDFKILSHRLDFFGICGNCRAENG
jgi:Fur family transcriptional regulator, peroxide stress response regulator